MVWYGVKSEGRGAGARLAPEPEGVGSRFVLEAEARAHEVGLPLHGLYNVENCLAAAACALALGLTLDEIAAAVRAVRPAAMRGVVHRTPAGCTLVDDSYNSNPDALGKALEGAARCCPGPRVAVLGDMRELGPRVRASTARRASGGGLGFAPWLASASCRASWRPAPGRGATPPAAGRRGRGRVGGSARARRAMWSWSRVPAA